MEFGRRIEHQPLECREEEPRSLGADIGAWWRGLATGQRQLAKFFALVLAAVGFCFILDSAPNPLRVLAPRLLPAVPFGAEHQHQIVVNLSLDGVAPDVARANAVLRNVCLVAAVPARNRRGEEKPLPKADPVSGDVRIDALVAAPILACLLERETARLCHKAERARMVQALRRYAELHAARAARFRTVLTSPMAPMVGLYEDFVDAHHQVDARRIDGQLIDARLARAIETASANGYIAARHFGGSVPPELAPSLVPAVMESCAR